VNFKELKSKLRGFGVPGKDIAPFEKLLGRTDTVLAEYTELLKSAPKTPRELYRLSIVKDKLKTCQEAISKRTIGLLKLHTGKRVLVVWGGARIKPNDPAYIRMVETIAKAGDGWIIIDGCGPGIMEAALRGAEAAGAIRIGLCMVSNKAFESTLDCAKNPWKEAHDLCFDHHDLFSRVAAFLEFADAVIIGKSGLGGTQEKAWLEGSIQCGMMQPIPVFVFSPDYWHGSRAHFANMLKAGAVSAEDGDLIRFVPEGEELKVFDRINKYYAARPHLLVATEPVVLPTAANSVRLAEVSAFSDKAA
jgi:predicted Rossmann-fold nucleotide-binding protein